MTAGVATPVGDDSELVVRVVVQSHSSAAGGTDEARVGGSGYSTTTTSTRTWSDTTTTGAAHCSLVDAHYGHVQGGVATAMLKLQTRALAGADQDHH